MDVMAVLQLATPCMAAASVVPLRLLPPDAPASSEAKPDAKEPAASGPKHSPMPLTVVAQQGALLLLEIISDPMLHTAEAMLQGAAQRAAASNKEAQAEAAQVWTDDVNAHAASAAAGVQPDGDAAMAQDDSSDDDVSARRRRIFGQLGADAMPASAPGADQQPWEDTGVPGAVTGTARLSMGWQPAPGGAGLDLGRDWRQRVQVNPLCINVPDDQCSTVPDAGPCNSRLQARKLCRQH
jgi:hypothetical protein